MNLALRIDNNIVAIIVSIIFLMNILSRLDKKDKKNQLFVAMFTLNSFELICETLTCIINKQPDMRLIPITIILHIILFILGPIVTYMWYAFANLWVNEDKIFKWQNNLLIMLPLIVNTLIVLISLNLKLVFYITEDNAYHRGLMFFVPVGTAYFYLIYSFIFIYKNREKINRVEFLPLLLFGVLPAIGGLIQSLFYGFLLMWSSIAFSLIMMYIYLQQQMIQIDYLTGAWSREKLNAYLENRINQNKVKIFPLYLLI